MLSSISIHPVVMESDVNSCVKLLIENIFTARSHLGSSCSIYLTLGSGSYDLRGVIVKSSLFLPWNEEKESERIEFRA